jgi:hypothetical protein
VDCQRGGHDSGGAQRGGGIWTGAALATKNRDREGARGRWSNPTMEIRADELTWFLRYSTVLKSP